MCGVRERAGAAFARVAARRLRPAFKVGGSERRQNRASHSAIRTRGQFLVSSRRPNDRSRRAQPGTLFLSYIRRIYIYISCISPLPSLPPSVLITFPRSTVFYLPLSLSPSLSSSSRVFVRGGAWRRKDIDESNILDFGGQH